MKKFRMVVITFWHRIFPPIEMRLQSMVSSDLRLARAELHSQLDALDARMARAIARK